MKTVILSLLGLGCISAVYAQSDTLPLRRSGSGSRAADGDTSVVAQAGNRPATANVISIQQQGHGRSVAVTQTSQGTQVLIRQDGDQSATVYQTGQGNQVSIIQSDETGTRISVQPLDSLPPGRPKRKSPPPSAGPKW
ncbi:hypothetical protein GCM10023187_18800 [Nibrella viscosa]|uniref:Curlin associated repeat-containing protein n=1 Tax=Nibrella viscosa TaxID=1084524 RepID=A0ABP8KAJ6_9BACT